MSEMNLSIKLTAQVAQAQAALDSMKDSLKAFSDAGKTAAGSIGAAFNTLGIRSSDKIISDINSINSALNKLKSSGAAPAELERASLAAASKLAALRAELGAVEKQSSATGKAAKSAGADIAGMGKSSESIASAAHRMAAFAASVYGIGKAIEGVKAILTTGAGFEKLEASLSFATGSMKAAKDEMAFIKKTADELKVPLLESAGAYVKLAAAAKGTALEGQSTRDIFTSIAGASRVMGLSADETAGALNAIQQMISKGTVSAEELRGQLGERLPGAFQIAARSIGVSTAELGKMLEQGQVISDDFLPKFAAELQKSIGGALPEATKTFSASMTDLKNKLILFLDAIAQSGALETFSKYIKQAASEIERMSASGELQAWAKSISEAISTTAAHIVSLVKNLIAIKTELGIGLAAWGVYALAVNGLAVALKKLPAVVKISLIVEGLNLLVEAAKWLGEFVAKLVHGDIEANRFSEASQRMSQHIAEMGAASQKAADGVNALLAKSAEASTLANTWHLVGESAQQAQDKIDIAAVGMIAAFNGMVGAGKSTADALNAIFDKVDFISPASIQAMESAITKLGAAGMASGEQIKAGLGKALEKLSGEDLVRFQFAAEVAFGGAEESAKKLALLLDASLSVAFTKLGGDLEKFRTGIDKTTKDAISAFQAIAENAQASSKDIGEAFRLALKTADTKQEIEALERALSEAAKAGRIGSEEVAAAQKQVKTAIKNTSDEKKKADKESEEDDEKRKNDTEEITEKISEQGAAYEALDASIQQFHKNAAGVGQFIATIYNDAKKAWEDSGQSAEEAQQTVNNWIKSLDAAARDQKNSGVGGVSELVAGIVLAKEKALEYAAAMKKAMENTEASTRALQAAASGVNRKFQEASNAASDMALGMSAARQAMAGASATSSDPALKAALTAQGEAARALAEAYRSVERSARQAAKSAQDAVRGFVGSSRGIHEELLMAQGKEEEAAQSRMASRKAELRIQYAQLQIQLQIASAQAAAAGIKDTSALDAAKAEAASAFSQAVKDLDELGKLESAKRKQQHQEEMARIAAEKIARKNQESEAERNAKAAITDAASQNSTSAARQIAQQTLNDNRTSSTSNNNATTTVNINGGSGSPEEMARSIAPYLNRLSQNSR